MGSVWVWPPLSINCRVNGIESHSLDKLARGWAGPYTRHFIEWMGHRPVCSTDYRLSGPGPYAGQVIEWVGNRPIRSALPQVSGPVSHSLNSLSIEWAWGIIQRIKELAANKKSRNWAARQPCYAVQIIGVHLRMIYLGWYGNPTSLCARSRNVVTVSKIPNLLLKYLPRSERYDHQNSDREFEVMGG